MLVQRRPNKTQQEQQGRTCSFCCRMLAQTVIDRRPMMPIADHTAVRSATTRLAYVNSPSAKTFKQWAVFGTRHPLYWYAGDVQRKETNRLH